MKKLLIALFAVVAGVGQLAADECVVYDACCSDCFGFDSILTFDVGGGYRQDNLQWDAYPPSYPATKLKEKWNNLQMGVVETNGQFLAWEHYLVKADFDFGWFNNQSGKQTIFAENVEPNYADNVFEDLKARTKGRVWDVSGALGYQFNWCCYRYAFTPLVGYSYHYQKFKNSEYTNELNDADNEIFVKNSYIYRWRGPTLGCTIAMQICTEWQVYFTYTYHWARFRGRVHERFSANADDLKMKSNNGSGNEFLLGTTYRFSDCWFLGLKLDYKCFNGDKGQFRVDSPLYEHANQVRYPLRNLKWDSFLGTMVVGFIF